MKAVFDFSDYREFLRDFLAPAGKRAKKGSLSALAQSIPCQVSYISRVMAGHADLSPEQAERIAEHIGLSADDAFYFLLLVEHARAGTTSLRRLLQKKMDQIKETRMDLKNRVGVKHSLSREDQSRYYGIWYYAAVHVMSGIPELQSKEAMAKRLGLPTSRVSEILDFLVSIGMIEELKDGRFKTGVGQIHLDRNSPMMIRHHSNWRIQALKKMEADLSTGVHYSVLVNVTHEDAKHLRAMVTQFIEDFMKVVHPSKDEETYCFALDFFNI